MCGIAGVINSKAVKEADVAAMIHAIRYRGQDEAGVVDVGNAVVGHARLAVVDPENGKQPMSNTDDTVWVTFNGEIYNYVELREELKAKGYRFKSRCDTEVLVHLWREEGEKMLDRLVGMFSFFIWDKKNNRGILARDRQGIKPCYIADYRGGVAFASEIKALLALPDFPKVVDDEGLGSVFAFNYCPPPRTCFKGVSHLEPGHYLLFEGNAAPKKVRYWQWPFFSERKTPSFDEFSAMLDEAVRIQMRFDVKGGMFLSGGVDSSVVAAHLVKQWNEPRLSAIGLDIRENGFSEYDYSQHVAKKYGIDLEPLTISASEFPDLASKVAFHADQPHGDFSFFLFYMLSRKAHQSGRIVMFNGDGPDEALLGFRHNEAHFAALSRTNFGMRLYFDLICYMNEEDRRTILSDDFRAKIGDPYQTFEKMLAPFEDLEPAEQVSAYELTSLMPGNNLIKGDRMGAAWSIEGRGPLLDHRISELFVRLPIQEKFSNGIGKHYLKTYALRHFDKSFVFRTKTMPTAPIGEWIKGPLHGWAYELLSQLDGRFNRAGVLKMLEEHRRGARNHTRQLRTLLMTQTWFKTFFQ